VHANGLRDYMHTIQIGLCGRHWHVGCDQAGRVGPMGRSLGEKSLGVGAPGSQFVLRNDDQINLPLLVRRLGPEKWGLCEEGSEPNLGENWTQFFRFFKVEINC
jgi:hypothetical protein